MVSTDPISDMLTRIRNANLIGRNSISMPHSKIKEDVARLLAANGYIISAKTDEAGGRKILELVISDPDQPGQITSIKRLSRPGRRSYVKSKEIPLVKRGRGIVIVSTSKGLMTGADAARQKLGGELLCEVY
ncbi:MAG TPA: 30S ribosomal protein S8 [Candidatus Saccharimonadales bacterium]|nr:30S ribosomal protein S8 [Candidatus Saccharimonadales bacterium]